MIVEDALYNSFIVFFVGIAGIKWHPEGDIFWPPQRGILMFLSRELQNVEVENCLVLRDFGRPSLAWVPEREA